MNHSSRKLQKSHPKTAVKAYLLQGLIPALHRHEIPVLFQDFSGFDRLAEISSGKYSCYMGFMTEDVALQHSLKRANDVERIYNSKRIPGIVFCPSNGVKTFQTRSSSNLAPESVVESGLNRHVVD